MHALTPILGQRPANFHSPPPPPGQMLPPGAEQGCAADYHPSALEKRVESNSEGCSKCQTSHGGRRHFLLLSFLSLFRTCLLIQGNGYIRNTEQIHVGLLILPLSHPRSRIVSENYLMAVTVIPFPSQPFHACSHFLQTPPPPQRLQHPTSMS